MRRRLWQSLLLCVVTAGLTACDAEHSPRGRGPAMPAVFPYSYECVPSGAGSKEGRLSVRYLCTDSGGSASVLWVDEGARRQAGPALRLDELS